MLDIRFTIPALPVLLTGFLLAALVIAVRLHRRRVFPWRTFAWRLVLAAYAAGVLRATLFPMQIIIGLQANRGPGINGINLVPNPGLDPVGFLLNMLLFAPLGMLLFRCWQRATVVRVAGVALLASLAIELSQLVTGLVFDAGRMADVNDLIANTSGALLGYLLTRRVAGRVAGLRHRRLQGSLATQPVSDPVAATR